MTNWQEIFSESFKINSMLKQIRKYTIICIVCLLSVNLYAQTTNYPLPAWTSEDGYWVIRSNIKLPFHHDIFFFNNENEMVGQTEINQKRLRWKTKKFRMRLKAMLELCLFFNMESINAELEEEGEHLPPQGSVAVSN